MSVSADRGFEFSGTERFEVLSGRISVTSQPQSGTTFTVTLPLRPSTAAASQAS